MNEQVKRYRVVSDFPEAEREALAVLCQMDYRPPAEQIRWLVVKEALNRGLLPRGNDNRTGVSQDIPSAVVA